MLPPVINRTDKTNGTSIWFRQLYLVSLIVLLALLSLYVPVAQAATITVTTTDDELNDDDDCSLREAIRAANLDQAVDACPAGKGTDTISLEAGEYVLTIGGNEDAALAGDLDLTADVTIIGAGQATTIINGNSLDSVFEIAANINVQISDVTIIGGDGSSSDEGGGFTVNEGGILNLINSTISGNNSYEGGGIFIDDGGTAILINSWINGNDASFQGGGIFINKDAVLTLTNGQVNGNTADSGGGIFVDEGTMSLTNSQVNGNNILGSDGGGIYISYSPAVTITTSQIISNTTDNFGGGLYVDHSTLTMTNTQVSSNTAPTDGGGIFLDDSTSTITGSQVSGNSIVGISVDDNSTLIFTNGQISGNTSTSDGAGIYNDGTARVVNSTISGNIAADDGGGLYNDGTFNLRNVTIANNTADSDGDNDGNGGGVYGGPFESGNVLITANSIIGDNVDNSPAGDHHPDCSGDLTGAGYNLLEDSTGCNLRGNGTGSMAGVDPALGPLQNNGGNTLTHALLDNSPAIDAGNPTGCIGAGGLSLTTDQRGFARPVDGNGDATSICDMGAYEYNAPDPTAPVDYLLYLPLIQK